MSKNTQHQNRRAKKKAEKRRKEKLREKKQLVHSPTNRLEVRLGKQVPQAWSGELPQDVALFDDSVLAQLPVEEAAEARLVREALAQVLERQHDENTELLASIPRRSVYSEWRMFVRGFVSWQAGKLDEAKEVWARLAKDRRPWRMAASLVLAHRTDLTELKLNGHASESSPTDSWVATADELLLSHAKLVRQTQVDRVALRAARGVLKIQAVEDATVGPEHVVWLRDFTKNHRSLEPELVQGLHEVAIRRAFNGIYIDVFRECVQHFQGPRHDRNNSLLKYFWALKTETPQPEKQLNDYLKAQLPQNKALSDTLRSAIASQLHCLQAALEQQAEPPRMFPFSFGRERKDNRKVIKHLENALKAFPANYNAYDAYEGLYLEQLEDDELLVDNRRQIESNLADVRQRRLKYFPGNVEVRLALVDYLLENDQSDEAQAHIKVLAGTRTDNPLADAMAWKWNILEAMRLSRRKTGIVQAREHLAAAELEWPRWLSKEWLPYLRAGLDYRSGQLSAFEAMPKTDRSPSKVADACMCLAAAQRLAVAPADLKPLRQVVEAHVKDIQQLSALDLCPLASFYWDLSRCGLKYPAQRHHGRKFLTQLKTRWNGGETFVNRLDETPVRAALMVMAQDGLFVQNYELSLPLQLSDEREQIFVKAVCLAAIIGASWTSRLESYSGLATEVRKAAETEPNVYDRWLFRNLADQYERKLQRASNSGLGAFGGLFSRFAEMLDNGGLEDDDDYDYDYDYDDDDEEICNCENCRRARGEI